MRLMVVIEKASSQDPVPQRYSFGEEAVLVFGLTCIYKPSNFSNLCSQPLKKKSSAISTLAASASSSSWFIGEKVQAKCKHATGKRHRKEAV